MATSGYFITSDSGQGGGGYYGQLVFEWWRDSWGRSGGVGYHNISYTLKSWGGSASYWQYAYNNNMNVDGTGYSRGQTQVYGAGATTILNGGKTLYTDSAGNRSFGASAQAGIYTAAVNSSGSGSWSLDNIPMYATISSYSGGITDEATNVYINYSNPTGSACTFALYVRPLGSTGGFTQILNKTSYASGSNAASLVDWAAVRSVLANHKQGQLIYRIINNVGNTDIGWENQALVTITNANPVFTTATYKDANSATVAITGNDQYLIQGHSTLEAQILSANKAVAQKSATMTKYNLAISSISTDVTYTTGNINQNLGTLGITADATLNVKAIDSRTNFTTVPLTVHVLPYSVPQLTVTAQRLNNFETSTDIHIEAVISRLTISGTDKNSVNGTSGVRYRYKKTTDGSYSSWVNVASSVSSGNVSTTDFNIPSTFDRNFAWNIQVQITDKLNTSTQNIVLPVGIPIFRIGLDGNVYNNEVRLTTVSDVILATNYSPLTGNLDTDNIPFLEGDIFEFTSSGIARDSSTVRPRLYIQNNSGTPSGYLEFDVKRRKNGTESNYTNTSIYPSPVNAKRLWYIWSGTIRRLNNRVMVSGTLHIFYEDATTPEYWDIFARTTTDLASTTTLKVRFYGDGTGSTGGYTENLRFTLRKLNI